MVLNKTHIEKLSLFFGITGVACVLTGLVFAAIYIIIRIVAVFGMVGLSLIMLGIGVLCLVVGFGIDP